MGVVRSSKNSHAFFSSPSLVLSYLPLLFSVSVSVTWKQANKQKGANKTATTKNE